MKVLLNFPSGVRVLFLYLEVVWGEPALVQAPQEVSFHLSSVLTMMLCVPLVREQTSWWWESWLRHTERLCQGSFFLYMMSAAHLALTPGCYLMLFRSQDLNFEGLSEKLEVMLISGSIVLVGSYQL